MDRFFKVAWSLFMIAVGAWLFAFVLRGSGLELKPSNSLTYGDFISLMLTSLGVMLAVLTIFLAVLAILGWASFKSLIEDAIQNYLKDRFGSDGDADPLSKDDRKLLEDLRRERLIDEGREPDPIPGDPNLDEDQQ
jgi:hypothetical protein